MKDHKLISGFYWLAGLYDGLLGLIFLFLGMAVFEYYQITPPNHIGYIQFPAALLIIFGLMFIAVAKNPVGYLIPCHRVITSAGKTHHYRWGGIRKKAILGWEASQVHPPETNLPETA